MRVPVLSATALLILAGCSLSAVAERTADRGNSWADARTRGAGTVQVLYVPAEGWAYHDAEGRLTGVSVEIMRKFAAWVHDAHGVRLELDFVEEPNWRTFYERVRLADGGVFGLGNVTITEPRRQELRFSPAYVTNVAVLIAHENVPELQRFEDLARAFAGLDALAFQGTLHETRLRRLRDEYSPGTAVEHATTNQEILDRVAGGGYFAYIDGYNYWRARDAGTPLRRHPVGDDPAEEFGIIMPLNSDWGPLMEEFFARDGGLRTTPGYRRLLAEHLGEQVAEALLQAAGGARSPVP